MNNSISINRIGLLYKQYYFINRNKLLLILIATAGLITGYHTFVHAVNYRYLGQQNFLSDYHLSSFGIALFAGCLLWCGNAFPELRNKERRMSYLIAPATSLEKFSFEVLNRIIVFIIVFPIIYWVFTNLVTSVFHSFVPDYADYKFSYRNPYPTGIDSLEIFLVLSLTLLVPTISFTGATYFQKIPIVKTIVVVFVIVALFVGYTLLIIDGFDLDEYNPINNRVLFIRGADEAKVAGIIAAFLVNITLLVISYFKVKEKEV